MISLDRLVDCLCSTELVDDRGDRSTNRSTWRAGTLGLAGGHVFGGQMIGQAVMIGSRLHPGMEVTSVSVVFPRGARDTGSLDDDVEVLHAGSTDATTRVECSRPGRDGEPAVGFGAHVMHRAPAEGIEHSAAMPDVGQPADARPIDLGLIPWETRVVGSTDLDDRAAQSAELRLWMRIDQDLPDLRPLHQALLAFASELTLIGTALLPHDGWSQLDAHVDLRTSVLAHAVQFHRPVRLDDWLLIAQVSPAASGGSAFGSGRVFDRAGELVAGFQQESMIRIEQERPRA